MSSAPSVSSACAVRSADYSAPVVGSLNVRATNVVATLANPEFRQAFYEKKKAQICAGDHVLL